MSEINRNQGIYIIFLCTCVEILAHYEKNGVILKLIISVCPVFMRGKKQQQQQQTNKT